MDWHQHFQEVFFAQWQRAGLPQPQLYTGAYIDARELHQQPIPFVETDAEQTTGIPYYKLKSVYGFGKVTGELYCELMHCSDETKAAVSDWCGRFNLGISLVDYICDEMQGGDRILSLDVFKPLLLPGSVLHKAMHPVEHLLSSLVASVFENVQEPGSAEIYSAFKKRFEAEELLASNIRSTTPDLKVIQEAMYLKSAEPFRVMALYAADNGSVAEPVLSAVQRFGKALGHCYWLIDDARDLWDYVAAGHWNLFLANDTILFQHTKEELTTLLQNLELAEKHSVAVIAGLVEALNAFDADEAVKQRAAGFIGASLWQWYCY